MSREFLWEPLSKLATVKAGTTPSRSDGDRFFNGGTINWVKTGDLNDGWLSETVERVTEVAIDETSLIVHPPGTVLVAMYGGFQQIGRSAILGRPAATNQAISALIPDPSKLHGEFLNYCLIFFRPNWEKVAASSRKDPNITKQDVLKFEIPVPPLHEQRRISEILSSVDEAIAATRAVIEQTKKVKQGVLERLLTKGIGHTRFRQTEIGEIPEGWEVVELMEVSDAITVGIASSATHAYRSKGIPLLRNQNIKAGLLDIADLLFVSPEYDAENASKRVKAGDVVSMRTGYPGRSVVIPPKFDGCQTFTTLVTKPKRSLVNSDFLCAWINSYGGMKQVRRLQAGGAQQNLNAGALKKLLVPLPPLTEQQQIALSAQSLLFDEELEIDVLNELKSALMSDLLSGRKRVTEALPMAAE